MHHSPSNILQFYKNKCLRESWSSDLGKGYKLFGLDKTKLLIRHRYFYLGRVIVITVFPRVIIIALNIKLFCCKNHKRYRKTVVVGRGFINLLLIKNPLYWLTPLFQILPNSPPPPFPRHPNPLFFLPCLFVRMCNQIILVVICYFA